MAPRTSGKRRWSSPRSSSPWRGGGKSRTSSCTWPCRRGHLLGCQLAARRSKRPDDAGRRVSRRPDKQRCRSRLRPSVFGTDGCGLVARGNPCTGPAKTHPKIRVKALRALFSGPVLPNSDGRQQEKSVSHLYPPPALGWRQSLRVTARWEVALSACDARIMGGDRRRGCPWCTGPRRRSTSCRCSVGSSMSTISTHARCVEFIRRGRCAHSEIVYPPRPDARHQPIG